MTTIRPSAIFLALGATLSFAAAPATSPWAQLGADGKLAYQTLPAGDRIMDFSSAGYMGGGVALPDVPEKKRVRPSGADDTAAIQAALDEIALLPLANGFRGAVVLERGEFHCSAALDVHFAGVVLRGSGSGIDGTVIKLIGRAHVGFVLGASGREPGVNTVAAPVAVTDAYVPAGARSLMVADASGFVVGDTVLVKHPVTEAWVKFMGMDGLVRDGKKQTWIATGGELRTERTITAIVKNTLTFNLPLTDDLDARYLAPTGASVVKSAPRARLAQIGVEHLRLVAPPQAVTINDPHHKAANFGAVEDAWLRDVAIVDTVNSISLGAGARRVTLDHVDLVHTVATQGAAKPADFSVSGSQILIQHCSDVGDSVFFSRRWAARRARMCCSIARFAATVGFNRICAGRPGCSSTTAACPTAASSS